VVFYSDGVVETANPNDTQYGTERLRKAIAAHARLSPAKLADRILEEVEEFAAGVPAYDDRTLVILKVK
jgi:sigma-B regulation protein RsbU (phosphoserine phosphatase)